MTRTNCVDCGSTDLDWWRTAYPSGKPSGYATQRCRSCYNAKVKQRWQAKRSTTPGLPAPGPGYDVGHPGLPFLPPTDGGDA